MRPMSDSFTDYNLSTDCDYSNSGYSSRSASLERNSDSPSVFPSALPSHPGIFRQHSAPVFVQKQESICKSAGLPRNNVVVKQARNKAFRQTYFSKVSFHSFNLGLFDVKLLDYCIKKEVCCLVT